jgi:hypothetical protein
MTEDLEAFTLSVLFIRRVVTSCAVFLRCNHIAVHGYITGIDSSNVAKAEPTIDYELMITLRIYSSELVMHFLLFQHWKTCKMASQNKESFRYASNSDFGCLQRCCHLAL